MVPPLRPGAKLAKVDGPAIGAARLILRPWRSGDGAGSRLSRSTRSSIASKPVTNRKSVSHSGWEQGDGEVDLFGNTNERWVTSRAS